MKKIGILTFHRAKNYGAYLQAYALCERLNQEEEIEAEIIDYNMKKEEEQYKVFQLMKNLKQTKHLYIKRSTFLKQLPKMRLSAERVVSDEIKDFEKMVRNKYDAIVVGSDEIWKVDGFKGFPNAYWLIGNLGAKKISYAASAMADFSLLSPDQMQILKDALNDFDYIGTRDKPSYTRVSEVVDERKKVHLNCDPSYIYDFNASPERGRKLLEKKYGYEKGKKCVGIMINSNKIVSYLLKTYGENVQFVSLVDLNKGVKTLSDVTPFEWMDIISALDFVVTKYFHGTCFSIINNTPVYTIETRAKQNYDSKLFNILLEFGMEDRYSLGVDDAILSGKMDYYLKDALKREKPDYSEYVIMQRNKFNVFLDEFYKIILT